MVSWKLWKVYLVISYITLTMFSISSFKASWNFSARLDVRQEWWHHSLYEVCVAVDSLYQLTTHLKSYKTVARILVLDMLEIDHVTSFIQFIALMAFVGHQTIVIITWLCHHVVKQISITEIRSVGKILRLSLWSMTQRGDSTLKSCASPRSIWTCFCCPRC